MKQEFQYSFKLWLFDDPVCQIPQLTVADFRTL